MNNPDWGQGYSEKASVEQIAEWERVKNIVTPITQGVYVSGFPTPEVLLQMESYDIDAVVSVTHEEPKGLPSRVNLYRFPFSDDARYIDTESATAAAMAVVGWLRAYRGGNVLVHCAYGLNRSPLVASIALHHIFGFSGKELIEVITEKRKGSLHNPLYRKYLESL